jgi:acetoin utilization protein AcuC
MERCARSAAGVRACLVDATALATYDLGRDHPFARDRQQALFDLLRRHHLFTAEEVLPVTAATRDELRTAHRDDYIDAVIALSAARPGSDAMSRAWQYGLGSGDNPIAPGLHAAGAAVVGATLACVRSVVRGEARAAFNPAGGLHHAMPARASGFCIYSDLVVAIRAALAHGLARVLYVDFDVHHGDGVQAAFEDEPRVLKISFHETPEVLFPGTGFAHERGTGKGLGYTIDVPLASFTADAAWLDAIRRVLVPAARAFRPELIVSQHGCDPHFSDPLANLQVTVQAMAEAAQITRDLADELCAGRWLATGGGGYRPYTVIPRAWSWVWAIVAGKELPAAIDAEWRASWRVRAGEDLPEKWPDVPPHDPRSSAAARIDAGVVDQIVARGFAGPAP